MRPDLTDFCHLAVERLSLPEKSVLPEQINSALGGISNLYIERLQQLHKRELEIDTTDAFCSNEVPVSKVLTEIGHCTGLQGEDRNAILNALKSTLATYFTSDGPATVYLGGIGRFKPLQIERSSYRLTAQNPLQAPAFRGPKFSR